MSVFTNLPCLLRDGETPRSEFLDGFLAVGDAGDELPEDLVLALRVESGELGHVLHDAEVGALGLSHSGQVAQLGQETNFRRLLVLSGPEQKLKKRNINI